MPSRVRAEASASRAWALLTQLQARLTGRGAEDPAWNEAHALEAAVLSGPIVSLDDVIAVLRVVALSLRGGPRTDGADAQALDRAIGWLGRQPPHAA